MNPPPVSKNGVCGGGGGGGGGGGTVGAVGGAVGEPVVGEAVGTYGVMKGISSLKGTHSFVCINAPTLQT